MKAYAGQDALEVYRKVAVDLLDNKTPHEVRGESMASEIIGCMLEVHDGTLLDFDIPGRSTPYKYLEALWDLGPSDRIDVLSNLNKGITRFVSDQPEYERENASWAYGPTIFKELPKVARHLDQDPYSRRGVITLPRDLRSNGTPPCLVSIQFFVRHNQLHCIAHMRSNDVWLGLPLDMFQFGLMQSVVSQFLGIPVGSYIHIANSMHLYQRDVKKVDQFVEDIVTNDNVSLRRIKLFDGALQEVEKSWLYTDLVSINLWGHATERPVNAPTPFDFYLGAIEEFFK